MGKSPGKWIKILLFGKKSSRSSTSKKHANRKGQEAKNGLSPHGRDSPVISHPLPVTSDQCANQESQKESSSDLPSNGIARDPVQEGKGSTNFCELGHINEDGDEQAAIKIQAAFRAYLARRAYRALWGIIRLQALYRGHLVRRQAVVTLRCIQGVVKLQAIVRGCKVRKSDVGLETHTKFSKAKDAKHVGYLSTSSTCQTANLSCNLFVNKLLSSPPHSKPLKLQYAKHEPNSACNWLERWSSTQFWRPISLPKKPIDVKPKARFGGYALETESGKLRRGPRKNFSSENGSAVNTPESEKSKRSLRKGNVPTAELVQEQPQSELEKVKRNLRKITSLYAQASDAAEGEGDRFKRTVKNATSSQADGPEPSPLNFAEKAKVDTFAEKVKIDNIQPPETKIDSIQPPESTSHGETVQTHDIEIETSIETEQKVALDTETELTAVTTVDENMTTYASNDSNVLAESNLQLKDENHAPINGQLKPKEVSEGTQKTSKRRASFPAKSESAGNGLRNTPALPSYMVATESAKAKIRGQISPRFSSDAIDKNGFARRHSLPSSTNGKLGQQPDHPLRAEWRR